jgi:lipoprotein-anchoring transpeptidase ErfK/SrfK
VFKQLLTGTYILGLLLVGNLSAQAQVQKPASSPSQTQAPTAPTAPQTQVSQEELQKFARTIKQLIAIEQGANQEMTQVIGQSGLTQDRFIEINRAQRSPSAKPTKAVTPQEKQQYDKAFSRLGEIQKQAESKMEQVVQKEGIPIKRFNEIEAAVRQDPAMQQKVRQMIQS